MAKTYQPGSYNTQYLKKKKKTQRVISVQRSQGYFTIS